MSEPLTLTDEQVDELNNHPPVKQARAAFLTALVAARGTDSREVLELEKEYHREFYERLGWLKANPPEPKSEKVYQTGFARHA